MPPFEKKLIFSMKSSLAVVVIGYHHKKNTRKERTFIVALDCACETLAKR